MSKAGRPKGTPQSEEARAKIAAAVRSRWNGPDGQALRAAYIARRRRPPPGTPERLLFQKIAAVVGAAAAYAELRRGV